MRIVLSMLLVAPPAFCMGMMFPLGLGLWRRHSELLPYFWSTNGITSMFGSAVGVALSIEFGIAATYAIGVGFYGVCVAMMLLGWTANRSSGFVESPSLSPAIDADINMPEPDDATTPALTNA